MCGCAAWLRRLWRLHESRDAAARLANELDAASTASDAEVAQTLRDPALAKLAEEFGLGFSLRSLVEELDAAEADGASDAEGPSCAKLQEI